MQLTTWRFGKLAAAFGAAGIVSALALSAFIPSTYVSTATMLATDAEIHQIEAKVLTRRTLAGIVSEADLDLYPSSRKRQPLEDVIDNMRKNIGISRERARASGSSALLMSFAYPDPAKAQKTLQALVSKIPQGLQIIDPPNFSLDPIKPNRGTIGLIGLVAGILLAAAAKLISRLRPA